MKSITWLCLFPLCFALNVVSPGFAATDQDDDGVDGPVSLEKPGFFAPGLDIPGNILVDQCHIGGLPVPGFLEGLQSMGWTVTAITDGPITLEMLLENDILIVSKVYLTYSADELAAVQTFVSAGGGLFVLGDINSQMPGTNSVAELYGVHFNPNEMVYDATDNEGSSFWPTIHVLDPHPVTAGVSEFGYYAGLCLEVEPPSVSIARGDEDAYSFSCPDAPTTIAVYEDEGRAVFYGDTTPFHDSYFPDNLDEDEIQLLFNIVNWLAEDHPVAAEATTWGSLKSKFR